MLPALTTCWRPNSWAARSPGQPVRQLTLLIKGSMGDFTSVCEVMIPAQSRQYRVLSVDPGPDGYDPAWVHENFSPLATRWLLSSDPPTAPDPISQARRALGFPPGTQAVQD